jgi:ubiquitin-protein ligase
MQKSSTASRRLQKEAKAITIAHENDVFLKIVNEDLFHWQAWILGPRDTPYAEGYYLLDITIPDSYPIQPPGVRFLTPVFHPNIQYKVRL